MRWINGVDFLALKYCFNVTEVVGLVSTFKGGYEQKVRDQEEDMQSEQKRERAY